MGKRSNFERIPRDFYSTPKEAVIPLLPHLKGYTTYIEPCAGDGTLIKHIPLECVLATDINPRNEGRIAAILKKDVLNYTQQDLRDAECFITNPPWDRDILHPLIHQLSKFLPTWLLFDADWMHTRQSSELIKRCRRIVSVGRVKWIPGSKMTGKDNCCWYLFDRFDTAPRFYGRK